MYTHLESDIWKWAIIFLLALILVLNWIGFITLDRKIDKALEQQGEVNQCVYDTNDKQSKSIRLLQTDSEIIMRLLLSKDFIVGEEQ